MLGLIGTVLAQGTGVITVTKPESFKIEDIGTLISGAIGAAFLIAGLIVFGYLIWGGIQWITAGGDKANVEAARSRITNALVGLAIIAAAWALMQIINYLFGVDFTGTLNLPDFYSGGGGAP